MYYTERKLKEKKWGRPGNEARVEVSLLITAMLEASAIFLSPSNTVTNGVSAQVMCLYSQSTPGPQPHPPGISIHN